MQQGQGVGDDQELEEETVTPRDQWKQVPRKSKFSTKYTDMLVQAVIIKETEN